MAGEWNHNIHYQPLLLDAVPRPCGAALDVGCGDGLLLPELAARADRVIGIDPDATCVETARAATAGLEGVRVVQGDVLDTDLDPPTFDFVSAVASLHHMPLEAGLTRLRDLVAPGGVLAIVGLARTRSIGDLAHDGIGFWATRLEARRHGGYWEHASPIKDPTASYGEVRRAADDLLPGHRYRRHVLFRYSIVWARP